MAEKEKISVAIYQLDLALLKKDGFDEVVDEVIKAAKRDPKKRVVYEEEKLLKGINKDFKVRLFSALKQNPPKWKKFLAAKLDPTSRIHSCTNRTYSYICFIGYKDHVFAVTGGFGNFSIERYTSDDFGLEILVRLFDKDSRVIKIIQDRGLTGILLGQNKYFRGDQRFSDEDQFGKIYKLVKADLNMKILTDTFGFSKLELTRASGCLAKSSFQISKSISFDMLLALVKRFTDILNTDKKFSLNKVEQISRKNPKNAPLLDELRDKLTENLYETCKRGGIPDIDFCHKDFQKYLTASSFTVDLDKSGEVEFERPPDFSDIIIALKNKKTYFEDDVFHFNASVLDRILYSSDEDGNLLTRGKVLQHVHGEVALKDNSYFLVDGEWYRILPDFIKDLDIQCQNVLKESWDDNLIDEHFTGKREGDFNRLFLGRNGWLVLDTITSDNIECCDLLQYDDTIIHLVHVKQGFDNSIRDLASQILISAKAIQEDIKSGYKYLEEIENTAKRGISSSSLNVQKIARQVFPKGGLPRIFRGKLNRQIVFCLAFVDTSSDKRTLKNDIHKFQSNIAKYSLVELHREIKSMGFDFRVIQLKK